MADKSIIIYRKPASRKETNVKNKQPYQDKTKKENNPIKPTIKKEHKQPNSNSNKQIVNNNKNNNQNKNNKKNNVENYTDRKFTKIKHDISNINVILRTEIDMQQRKQTINELLDVLQKSFDNQILSYKFYLIVDDGIKKNLINKKEVFDLIKLSAFSYLEKTCSEDLASSKISYLDNLNNNILNNISFKLIAEDDKLDVCLIDNNYNYIINKAAQIQSSYNKLNNFEKIINKPINDKIINKLKERYEAIGDLSNKKRDWERELRMAVFRYNHKHKLKNIANFAKENFYNEYKSAVKDALIAYIYKQMNEGSIELLEIINILINAKILNSDFFDYIMKNKYSEWFSKVLSNNNYVYNSMKFLSEEGDKNVSENNIFSIIKILLEKDLLDQKIIEKILENKIVEKKNKNDIIGYIFLTSLCKIFNFTKIEDYDKKFVIENFENLIDSKQYYSIFLAIKYLDEIKINYDIVLKIFETKSINDKLLKCIDDIYNIKYTYSLFYFMGKLNFIEKMSKFGLLNSDQYQILTDMINKIDGNKLKNTLDEYDKLLGEETTNTVKSFIQMYIPDLYAKLIDSNNNDFNNDKNDDEYEKSNSSKEVGDYDDFTKN
ncbi:MAG: hypothetical protein M1538_01150 [Candidatus Marsarchaeota archaeon]|jgi:hypothetical protein|nr:hypothetical protein [Candidatus Marsarchaeota archaeon]